MLYTTFDLLRETRACNDGYRKLAKYLGGVKKYGAQTPVPLAEILKSNGIDDTLWVLRCCTDSEKARRLSQIIACDYAEHVLHFWEEKFPGDKRPRAAIETSRRYIKGTATAEEVDAAGAAASAARAAAGAAVWVAASAAVWAAASAARDAAARAAAWAAAGDAAWDAESAWQKTRFSKLLEAN